MAKKGSLFFQMTSELNKQKAIGDAWRGNGGKHAAKQVYRQEQSETGAAWNPAKATGIFSYGTYDAYAKSLKEFAGYLKEKGIRDASAVTREHAVEFLREKSERGNSSSTIAKDTSAINKIFEYGITRRDTGIEKRSEQEIKRGRSMDRDERYEQRERANSAQIEFIKAFGVRRQSVQPSANHYPVKPVSLFRRDGEIYCSLIEKGGKYREALCLEPYKAMIEERYEIQDLQEERSKESFKELYHASQEETLFRAFDKNVTAHAYRAEYACELYERIEQQRHLDGVEVREDYRGYDREICCEVARHLGHGDNRPEVFAVNYAYGFERL